MPSFTRPMQVRKYWHLLAAYWPKTVLVGMVDTSSTNKFPLMVELVNGKDFLVSAIPEGKDDFASYVEVLVSDKDADLYDFFIQKVGILNISGTNEEIPGVGEKYDDTIFSLFVDKIIHDKIVTGRNIAHDKPFE